MKPAPPVMRYFTSTALPCGCRRSERSRKTSLYPNRPSHYPNTTRQYIASMPDDRPKIRVLRVIARMNLGGPAHQAALLSGRLDSSRYETLLITGAVGPGEEEHELAGVE